MTTLTMGARLDRLPVSPFHRRMLILIGLGLFVDSFEVTLMASVLGALVQSGMSDVPTNAKFISTTFAGLAVGALFAGYVGDRYGRRFAYQFNLLLFGLMSFVAAMAPTMSWLIVARFFMGVGMGAEFVIGYGFISEFVPPARRGRSIAIVALASNTAQLISAVVGLAVIPTLGWRWMFVIAGCLALVVWFMRKSMPESPRWLEAVGRNQEAERIMRSIEQESGVDYIKSDPVLVPAEANVTMPPARSSIATTLAALFTPPVLRRTLLGIFVTVVVLVGNYSFSAWLPTFLVKQGYSIVQSLWYSMLMSIGAVAGPLLGLFLSDKIGRKYGIAAVAILAAIAGIIYPYLTSIAAITVCGFFIVGLALLSIALGLGTYVPELFPTPYRMRGSGLCQFAGRVATILMPFAVVALFESYGVGGVIYSIAGLYFALAVVMLWFGIETTGKPLEIIGQTVMDPGEEAAASVVNSPVKAG